MKKEGPGRLQWVKRWWNGIRPTTAKYHGKSEEASENYDKDAKEKQEKGLKDRKDAKEVCQKALESFAQTRKWHSEEAEQSQGSSRKRPKKIRSETMLY